MDGFYSTPGTRLEPGDIFLDIPFPALKHPLEFFRPSPKDPKAASIFRPEDKVSPKSGDTARGAFQQSRVILLSHGCELDGVKRDVEAKKTEWDRRYWLGAPVRDFAVLTAEALKDRTRNGTQANKFHLPAHELNGGVEYFVDLRKITPINAPYFLGAKKVSSLTSAAMLALQAHIGLFFSGLILYVQPIPCPACGATIDPARFVTPSTDEEEID
jgi:hypothetical protein